MLLILCRLSRIKLKTGEVIQELRAVPVGMSNSWLELLKQTDECKLTPSCVVVIAAPTIETLRAFERSFLPQNCSFNNKSMDLVGFTSNKFRESDGHDKTIELYSVLFPLTEEKMRFLEAFVDITTVNIKWWFLLDWALSSQRTWLRDLNDSMNILKSEDANLLAGSITTTCLNTDHIYFKLRNTTEWHSSHVEFLQQSLRSFCLLKKCSLIYADPDASGTSGQQVFIKLLFDNYREIQAEFVSACKILIPYGSDTYGLIKTLDDTFEPSKVVEDTFISQKYEKIIPGPKYVSLQETEDIEADGNFDRDHPYYVDVQQKLSELYEVGKKCFPNANA